VANRRTRSLSWLIVGFVVAGLTAGACGGGGSGGKDGGSGGRDGGSGGRGGAPDGGATGGRGGGTGGAAAAGGGMVTDRMLIINPAVVTLREGDMQTFMITLSRPPTSQITLDVATSDKTVASLPQAQVTFETGEVGPMPVVVLAPHDPDLGNDTATVTLTGDGVRAGTVRVQVTDDDMQQIVVTPGIKTSVTEGTSSPIGVRLAYKPTNPLTLTLASANTAELMISATTLTFDGDNYLVPQAVSLTAPQDADAMSEKVNVTITPGTNSDAAAAAVAVEVTIDDDEAVNLVLDTHDVAVKEDTPPAGAVKVKLTKEPEGGTLTVAVATTSAKITVSPTVLTFTTANFGTDQTVTITPVSDNMDIRNEMATVTLTPSATNVLAHTVNVVVTDDDRQRITAAPTALMINEGESATVDVSLSFDPAGPATVNVFSSNGSKVEVTPSALVFNSANFSVPQRVTVQSREDEDLMDENVTLSLISPVAEEPRTIAVMVKDKDKQEIQLINASEPLMMQEGQPGSPSTAIIGVRLSKRPTANVSVALATSEPAPKTKLILSQPMLTFGPGDYSTPQFVTLRADHDDDIEDAQFTVTFSANEVPMAKLLTVQIADTDRQGISIIEVANTNPVGVLQLGEKSNDGCNAMATTTTASTRQFRVRLNVRPPAATTVTLTPTPGPNAAFTVNPGTMAAPAGTAPAPVTVNIPTDNAPQTVTIATNFDCDTVGGAGSLALTAPGGLSTTVNVMVLDEDVMSLVIVPGQNATQNPPDTGAVSLVLKEDSDNNPMGMPPTMPATSATAETATFTVKLTKTPVPAANVSIVPSATGVVTIAPLSGAGSTTGFLVTVRGQEDLNLIPDSLTLRVSVPISGVPDQFVSVTENDDDAQGLVISPLTQITVNEEGAAETFTVRLLQEPPTSTTVTVSVNSPSFKLSVDGNPAVSSLELMFDATNFMMTRTISVTAVGDANTRNEDADVSISNPAFAVNQIVPVKSVDNDQQAIIIDDNSGPDTSASPVAFPLVSLIEKQQDADCSTGTGPNCPRTLRVRLRFPPNGGGDEVINITNPGAGFTVTPASLTFNSTTNVPGASWNMDRLVTIKPVLDADIADPSNATVTFHSALATPVPMTALAPDRLVPVTVDDQDVQALVFAGLTANGANAGTIELTESTTSSTAVTVRLLADPLGTDVSVVCTSGTPDEVKLNGGNSQTLTFSGGGGGSWPTPKTLTINPLVDDEDAVRETVTVTCVSTGGAPAGGHNLTTPFTVVKKDNDSQLNVVVIGGGEVDSGAGDVISNCVSLPAPAGVCTAVYPASPGTVTLMATPADDWAFGGWTGAGCTPVMSSNNATVSYPSVDDEIVRTCTVTFNAVLSVVVSGPGSVTSSPAGIMTCTDATCTAAFGPTASVTLTATPGPDAVVTWGGDCASAGMTLTSPALAMSSPKSCTATFSVP
jgi:hypothetical protein